ncbi:hypothetical protein QR680_016532 [Steinernema hermaphroditum]|uniref:Uncharacterized protein n=1 Tax=Steinernema hermaphroditum TaxID=289476 RepID=A0AA39HBI2_9BILA|nr:hypothetical protein QR680_016532 [Steinernema hermaphroditum]
MNIISRSQAKLLSEFARTKRLIAVVVKGQRDFFLNLEDLAEQRPQDVGLFAFAPKESKFNETVQRFDAVIGYDVKETVGKKFRTFEEIEIPELDPFMEELTRIVPKEKICMIHCEENSIAAVCRTRKRFGLGGRSFYWVGALKMSVT